MTNENNLDLETKEEEHEEDEECGHVKYIEDLNNELQRLRVKNLELLSEMDNLRKRHIHDMDQSSKYANSRFAVDVLSIVDAIEMAMNAAQANPQIYEGIKMSYANIQKQLKKNHINLIPVKSGDSFDSNLHSVLSQVEDDSLEENTIVNIPMSGYTMFDRVLRPAQVIVSKKREE